MPSSHDYFITYPRRFCILAVALILTGFTALAYPASLVIAGLARSSGADHTSGFVVSVLALSLDAAGIWIAKRVLRSQRRRSTHVYRPLANRIVGLGLLMVPMGIVLAALMLLA